MLNVSLVERPTHVPAESVIDFDVYNPPGLNVDFHEAWMSLQGRGLPELVWTPRNGGHWMPTKGPLVSKLMTDHARLSSRSMQVPRERAVGNAPIPGSMDPPTQTPFHTLVVSALSPNAVRGLEPAVKDLTNSLIDDLLPKGRCEFVAEFAILLPLRIFIDYAGLPRADLPMLRELAEEKVRPSGRITAAEVMKQLAAYLDPYVRQRAANPGKDLVSLLVSSKIDGRPMTHDEGIRLCSQILVAGLDTVAGILTFTTLYLARNPTLRRQLTEHPELVPAAVEEFLRRFPLVAIGREVRTDFEIGQVTLREGDMIVLPTMLYGLNEEAFPQPLNVNLERKQSNHLTFGTGVHRCPGAPLARLELRIFLHEWLRRIPEFELGDEPIRYKSGVVGTIANLPIVWSR